MKCLFMICIVGFLSNSCSKYITISGKPTIMMRNEADDPDYFEEMGVSLPQYSSKQAFLITFDPPRLKDSVLAEYDTLDNIKLKVLREDIKKPVPENVMIRATKAERIK